mmetsp:Transcript_19875/g.34007  ORF Transcript_19875/g.34007 Transcript_19875/m.34007 type:complete len:121 (-) Transcript_19875:72-434(-)
MAFVHLPLEKAANARSEDLEDWGFRAGAGEGECKIAGVFFSRENGVKTGIWECSPGSFPVEKRTNTESCYILAGKVKITDMDKDNAEVEMGPGESFVLEKGSSVRWTIIETCRKFFVIAD